MLLTFQMPLVMYYQDTSKKPQEIPQSQIIAYIWHEEEGENIIVNLTNTVSHFRYAPPFQGPHFLTKMLESNILYAHLLIDILFDDIEKISKSLMRIILQRQKQF